jgi:CxxC motif-containing protein (DUF1111 family)
MHLRSRIYWSVLVSLCVPAAWACSAADENNEDIGQTTQALNPGDSLPGISAADFALVRDNFAAQEGPADGLGPIINANACGTCHNLGGAIGGAGQQVERRFGRFANGVFNPLANEGGSLRQLFSLGTWKSGCNVPVEVEPADATVHNVGRLTTPLLGLGLVDAMPDSFFTALAAAEPAATRGIAVIVRNLLPNPRDASQTLNGNRVARFGWKPGVSNLAEFSADAYVNEMGITTQHCIKGVSVTAFASENLPNNRAISLDCQDGIPGTDDVVGSCAGGLTELQGDVQNFTTFMTFLAPPPRGAVGATELAGQAVFDAVGCANCHTRQVFRTPNPSPNGVPGNYAFQPYSDFLAHDMGTLGDQIGNQGDSLAVTRRMRTAPLWGLRFRNLKLHDGRTTDTYAAIRAHDGQAAAAKNAFNARNSTDQHNLVAFLLSL